MQLLKYITFLGILVLGMTFDLTTKTFHAPFQSGLTDNVLGTLLATCIVAVLNLLTRKPKLNGVWDVVETVEFSTETIDPVSKIYYIFSILQKGNELTGSLEKVGEDSINHGHVEYLRKNRIRGTFTGHLEVSYFKKPIISLHIEEKGRLRDSSTTILIRPIKKDKMEGTFQSTAADASGKILFIKK